MWPGQMMAAPGTSRQRVALVDRVEDDLSIFITQYHEARQLTLSGTYETVCRSVSPVTPAGTPATRLEEKSSQRKSGRTSRPHNSKDKG